jgi:hypothetical protein
LHTHVHLGQGIVNAKELAIEVDNSGTLVKNDILYIVTILKQLLC